MVFYPVAKKSEIPLGEAKVIELGERQIALFNLKSAYYAIDNICPHSAGPLAMGAVEDKLVYCPWHGWPFNLEDGQSPTIPSACVETFKVKIEGDEIFIEIN